MQSVGHLGSQRTHTRADSKAGPFSGGAKRPANRQEGDHGRHGAWEAPSSLLPACSREAGVATGILLTKAEQVSDDLVYAAGLRA
jgi:hypothetical protein